MHRLIACLGLALGLAGCAGTDFAYERSSYTPTPPAEVAGQSWHKDCKPGGQKVAVGCQLELYVRQADGGTLIAFAGRYKGQLVLGFKAPPQTLDLRVYQENNPVQGVEFLGCNVQNCAAIWFVQKPQERRLFASGLLQVWYTLPEGSPQIAWINTDTLHQALAAL